jgi:hypothetical protein
VALEDTGLGVGTGGTMVGRIWFIVVVFCGLVIGRAWAAGVTFSDRAAFEAAIGAHRTYTFDPVNGFATAPAPISSVDGGFLQLSSNGGAASLDTYGAAGNQALTGRSNNQVDRTASVSIIPAGHQNAIGFDILDLGANGVEGAYILVSDNTDRPVSPFLVQDNDGNSATPVFFGVIWDVDMTGMDIHAENLLCVGPGICMTPNLVDNVTVAPEPGTLVLLAGVFLIMRRRTRAISARG